MLAALILIISASALIQFFLAYCRSLLRMYSKIELSANVRRIVGFDVAGPDDAFPRILRLLDCDPAPRDDRAEVLAICVYHFVLGVICAAACFWPAIAYWVTAEREDCAHFAAVALDRRIASQVGDFT